MTTRQWRTVLLTGLGGAAGGMLGALLLYQSFEAVQVAGLAAFVGGAIGAAWRVGRQEPHR
jgi:hypothetical protein